MSLDPNQLIATADPLKELGEQLALAPWVAIDTEADSLRSYPDKLCLIQVSIPQGDYLVDPMAGLDMAPFFEPLKKRELLFHGADYDLRLLRRNYGFLPDRVFDTMLASRLLGIMEFGLAALVLRYFNQTLTKSAQKADWRQRPLPPLMIEYARKDSHFLRELSSILRAELVEKGRLEWHEQLCARGVRDAAQDSPVDADECWRLKGSNKLSPRALGILRELWHWREREAIEASKPPFFILAHDTLIGLAFYAAEHGIEGVTFPHHVRERRRVGALIAIEEGLALTEDQLPTNKRPRGRRLTWAEGEQMEKLRQKRDAIATRLALDPSLIATRSELAGLALDWKEQASAMMPWQVGLLESEGGLG